MLEPLNEEDIQDKIDINLSKGMSHEEILYSLTKERQEFVRVRLRNDMQIANLTEQIEYLQKIMGLTNGKLSE